MKTLLFLTFLSALLLTAVGCGPDWAFKKAEKARTQEAFEQFISKYPESELVERAQYRLAELDYWTEVESTLTRVPYEAYLDSFPDGLFLKEAAALQQEVIDFEAARGEDLIESYSDFEMKYQTSMFADSIAQRLEVLRPAAKGYEIVKAETNLDALRAYVNEHHGNGYGKLIIARLDSIAIQLAEAEVLAKEMYDGLPDELSSLISYIEANSEVENIRLAKQAYEDILVEQIKYAGPGNRFVIQDIAIPIKPGWEGYRYSIRSGADTQTTKLSFSVEGGNCSTSSSQARIIIYTDYPSDLIPLTLPPFNETMGCTGSARGNDIVIADGIVWRFVSDLSTGIHPNYRIYGDPNDPISFYLMHNVGLIHIHGRGSIETEEGKILFSNLQTDLGDDSAL